MKATTKKRFIFLLTALHIALHQLMYLLANFPPLLLECKLQEVSGLVYIIYCCTVG
jgi:hypothetical protein